MPDIRDAVLAASAPRLYVCNVATQAGETTGMDLARHVEALVAHTGPGICDLVLANDRFDARVPPDWVAESVRLEWPPAVSPEPRLDPGAGGRSGQRPPPRPGRPGRGHPARLRGRAPGPSTGRGAERMTRSERDLVTALRAELAAIDPARPCDRLAEAAGLGVDAVPRDPAVGRLAVRLRRVALADASAVAAFDWAGAPGALPDRLAARPLPGPRLAEPGRRPDPPGVRGARPTRPRSWRPGSTRSACRRPGGCAGVAAW